MSLRSKKATVTWTYVGYEWPNTDWTGNIQLRCRGYSQVLAKMEVLAPLLRFISCISASQRRKPHCHSCFGEAGRPPAYAFEPCKGLYMVLYIYITLVGTRNSAKKVDHPLFTTIHPPPEVQYLKQRYALTCSAHCWSFLRAVGFRWLACIDLYRFVVTKGDPLRFHHHISVIMIMMVQWQSRLS